jgi:hypothetical protein
MKDIFVQTEGIGKGTRLELITEKGNDVVVRNVKTDFIFYISKKEFASCYRREDNAKN